MAASMKYAIKEMLKTNGGSIVNLASIAGLNGLYGTTIIHSYKENKGVIRNDENEGKTRFCSKTPLIFSGSCGKVLSVKV